MQPAVASKVFVSWPEIEGFHNVRLAIKHEPSIAGDRPRVTYRGKVKLHGTNAAVQVLESGELLAQSRSALLTIESDNAGFARWLETGKEVWQAALRGKPPMILFGEWCGPGIQRGVAVNLLPQKIFVVFAASALGTDELVVEPEDLARLVGGIPQVHVLPWHDGAFEVDWSEPPEALSGVVAMINEAVEEVELRDPWIHSTFGVEGVGEGLVYYPVSHPGRLAFANLCFKAKGEKHRVVRSKAAAQLDPEVASGAEQFAAMVLTEARLEQGARASDLSGELRFDTRRIGAFLGWVTRDVSKETEAELEASGLTWKQVSRAVTDAARSWYLKRIAAG